MYPFLKVAIKAAWEHVMSEKTSSKNPAAIKIKKLVVDDRPIVHDELERIYY